MEVLLLISIGLIGFAVYGFNQMGKATKLQNEMNKKDLENLNNVLEENGFNKNKELVYGLKTLDGKLNGLVLIRALIDINNKKIAIIKSREYKVLETEGSLIINHLNKYEQSIDIFDYKDILKCDIIENESIIMEGGVGRAIVGGVIAGGVGAIVGVNSRKSNSIIHNLSLRIVCKNELYAFFDIKLIAKETQVNSEEYNNAYQYAQEVYSLINSCISHKENSTLNNTEESVDSTDVISRMEKLTKLKESGLITKQEYQEKKENILGKL